MPCALLSLRRRACQERRALSADMDLLDGLRPGTAGRWFLLNGSPCLGWIRDRGASDFGERRQGMSLAASRAHDVLGADSANEQGVRDERAMTAPGQRFRAHQCDPVLLRQPYQFNEISLEFRLLHVIRETSKRGISPAHVGRIAQGMTESAESRHVNIFQPGTLQRLRQGSLVELGVVPGTRHRPHVHHAGRAVRLEQADEFLDRARGMADRQDSGVAALRAGCGGGATAFRTPASASLSNSR